MGWMGTWIQYYNVGALLSPQSNVRISPAYVAWFAMMEKNEEKKPLCQIKPS